MMSTEKTCAQCGETKPATMQHWYKRKVKGGGGTLAGSFRSICRLCRATGNARRSLPRHIVVCDDCGGGPTPVNLPADIEPGEQVTLDGVVMWRLVPYRGKNLCRTCLCPDLTQADIFAIMSRNRNGEQMQQHREMYGRGEA